jgi:hypothetical protein
VPSGKASAVTLIKRRQLEVWWQIEAERPV